MEKKIIGTWAIDYIIAPFDLRTNGLGIKEGSLIKLPSTDGQDEWRTEKAYGDWELYKEREQYFLKIDTPNERFHGVYKIMDFRTELDPKSHGYFLKMTLKSDKVTMYCTRPDYS